MLKKDQGTRERAKFAKESFVKFERSINEVPRFSEGGGDMKPQRRHVRVDGGLSDQPR